MRLPERVFAPRNEPEQPSQKGSGSLRAKMKDERVQRFILYLTILLISVPVATLALNNVLGRDITGEWTYWVALGAVAILVLIAVTEKSVSLAPVKSMAYKILWALILLMAVRSVWPNTNLITAHERWAKHRVTKAVHTSAPAPRRSSHAYHVVGEPHIFIGRGIGETEEEREKNTVYIGEEGTDILRGDIVQIDTPGKFLVGNGGWETYYEHNRKKMVNPLNTGAYRRVLATKGARITVTIYRR